MLKRSSAKATIDEVKDMIRTTRRSRRSTSGRELQEMIDEVAVVENVKIALPEPISVTTRKLLDTDTAEELDQNCCVNAALLWHVITDVFEEMASLHVEQADDDMKKVYCLGQGLTVTGHKKVTQEYKAQVSNNKPGLQRC